MHQIRHPAICGTRHTNPTHKSQLCKKSVPCSNAQAILCGATQTHIIDDHGERANVQHELCGNCQKDVYFTLNKTSHKFFTVILHATELL